MYSVMLTLTKPVVYVLSEVVDVRCHFNPVKDYNQSCANNIVTYNKKVDGSLVAAVLFHIKSICVPLYFGFTTRNTGELKL